MPPEADNETDTVSDSVSESYVPVAEFFSEKAVFVTGATGFLGKVLIEKLLRSCPGVKVIYLLMRPKRGRDLAARLSDIINSPLFDRLKQEYPLAINKLVPVQGDISEPELGISQADKEVLIRNVSVVFHSAATVRFDEPLRIAVQINLLGTRKILDLCRAMAGLQALVHVSTCYCNCDREEIQEVVYPPSHDPEAIIQSMEWMDDELLKAITPKLLGKRPNTYTFTKALTESLLQKEGKGLPITIVRPTIMTSTCREPMSGWIEGLNGTTGVIAAYGKGIMRSMICHGEKVGDIIPADIVINLTICAAWRTATERNERLMVYNCCSGSRHHITWNQMFTPVQKTVRSHPSQSVLWYPSGSPYCKSVVFHKFREIFLHFIPAYLFDTVTRLSNKRPILARIQKKMSAGTASLAFFTSREFKFTDDNTLRLSKCLNQEDSKIFFFNIADIDWPSYMVDYTLGVRTHINKEHPNTIPRSRILMNRLLWLHRLFRVLPILLMLRVKSIRNVLFGILDLFLRLSKMIPILFSQNY